MTRPTTKPTEPAIAEALARIADRLHSVNEPDSNMEPANLVDTGAEQARALHRIATAIDRLAAAVEKRDTGH